jgi:hypothetical protein
VTTTAGLWEADEIVDTSAAPVVLIPACEVPDGKMPQGARLAAAKVADAGFDWSAAYASAIVSGVRRKVDGAFIKAALIRESVSVRFAGFGMRGFLVWACVASGGWKTSAAAIRGRGQLGTFAISDLESVLHDAVLGLPISRLHIAPPTKEAKAPRSRKKIAPPPLRGPMIFNVWLGMGTPGGGVYPCRCNEPSWAPGRNCGPGRYPCPCWGRTDDLGSMPANCCALRAPLTMFGRTARFGVIQGNLYESSTI